MSAASVAFSHVGKIYQPSPRWLRFLVRTPIKSPVLALEDVSFEVGPGEVCAVVGPNGAGKTTLFRILVGLATPTSGSARVLGYDALHESLAIRRRLGWMPTEDGSLVLRLSCAENLRFHGRLKGLHGRSLQMAIDQSLELVGLRHVAQSAVFTLSAGMKARLQLARAIMHRPEVLILDEPTAAVDPVGSFELLNLIGEIVQDLNVAALISSHRLDEIEVLHSHVVLLNRGRLLFDGDLDDLRTRIDRPHMEMTLTSADASSRVAEMLRNLGYAEVFEVSDRQIRFAINRGQTLGVILEKLDGLLTEIEAASAVRLPLRDLLVEVYGADSKEEA